MQLYCDYWGFLRWLISAMRKKVKKKKNADNVYSKYFERVFNFGNDFIIDRMEAQFMNNIS